MEDSRSLARMVQKHDEDLYRGDPPGTGLTTRMALLEAEVEKFARNTNKLIFAILTVLLVVIGDIIKNAMLR